MLARPEFAAWQQFLTTRQDDLDALQIAIDQLLAQADSPLAILPLPLQQLFATVFEAAQSGQDVEPLLAAIRTELIEEFPEDEPQIDALLTEIRTRLPTPSPSNP